MVIGQLALNEKMGSERSRKLHERNHMMILQYKILYQFQSIFPKKNVGASQIFSGHSILKW